MTHPAVLNIKKKMTLKKSSQEMLLSSQDLVSSKPGKILPCSIFLALKKSRKKKTKKTKTTAYNNLENELKEKQFWLKSDENFTKVYMNEMGG